MANRPASASEPTLGRPSPEVAEARDAPDRRERERRIANEQITMLVQQSGRTVPFHLMAAAVTIGILWTSVATPPLIAWGLLVALTVAGRSLHYRRTLAAEARSPGRPPVGLLAWVAASGAAWGGGAAAFAPLLDSAHLALLLVVLCGLTAAAVISLSFVRAAFLAFVGPLLLPMAAWTLTGDSLFHLAAGALVAIYLVVGTRLVWTLQAHLRRHVELTFSHQELADRLERANRSLREVNRELRHLSFRDSLTGLRNRRTLNRELARAWGRGARTGRELSLLLVDIDCFKPYNDTYGHPAGDASLRRVAEVLEAAAQRPDDIVARYGGEEFALLLPDTTAAGAGRVGERLRRRVEEERIPHRASTVGPWVTVSVGIATLTPDAESGWERLVESADRALYRAKLGGRNRVEAGDRTDGEDVAHRPRVACGA